jgi:hypothetical protein
LLAGREREREREEGRLGFLGSLREVEQLSRIMLLLNFK